MLVLLKSQNKEIVDQKTAKSKQASRQNHLKKIQIKNLKRIWTLDGQKKIT
jgi:hypothetical protein